MNCRIDIQDFAIYAVLTDTKQWEFHAYDGGKRKFYTDEPINLSGQPLEDHWLYIKKMVGLQQNLRHDFAGLYQYAQSIY